MNFRKFKNCKVISSLLNNIWAADIVGIQLISKYNQVIQFLLSLNIFSRYAWFIS